MPSDAQEPKAKNFRADWRLMVGPTVVGGLLDLLGVVLNGRVNPKSGLLLIVGFLAGIVLFAVMSLLDAVRGER
jgi:hypothetical protein